MLKWYDLVIFAFSWHLFAWLFRALLFMGLSKVPGMIKGQFEASTKGGEK